MTRLVLDAELRGRLNNLRQPLELCDESGTVLARLIPILDPRQYEPVEPELSAEDRERLRAEPVYTTAQVLAHLEKL